MARIQYVAKLAVDRDTGLPVSSLENQVVTIVKRGTTTPAAISEDEAGALLIPGAVRTVSSNLFIPSFWVDPTEGPISALGGGVEVPLESVEGVARRLDALEPQFGASVAAAEGAQAAAEASTAEVATLRKWVELGVTQRNYCLNPRAVGSVSSGVIAGFGTYLAGTGETGTTTVVTGATDGPVLPDGTRVTTYARRHIDAPKTGGSTGWQGRSSSVRAPMAGVVGDRISVALYLRYGGSGAGVTLEPRLRVSTFADMTSGASEVLLGDSAVGALRLVPGQWVRVETMREATADFGGVGWWAYFAGATSANQIPAANTDLDAVCVLVTDAATVPAHSDGDMVSSKSKGYRWSGTPNASVSEMIDMSAISSDLVAAAEAAADAAEAAANTNLPSGGNTGQVLAKRSGQDRDVEWVTPSGGSGGGATTWDQIAGKPSTYPASGHTHPMSQISDASGLGRQLLAAGDAQTARSIIGAGTPVAGFPGFGTTATTAAPGNHTHSQYVDSSQAATIADQRIAAAGGGGGGTILFWRYQNGAWPALPSTKPAGVELIKAMGPVGVSSVPSWVGNGAGQVPLEYTYNGALA